MLTLFALFIVSLSAQAREDLGNLQRYAYEKAEMGVPFRLIFYASDEEAAKVASEAAFIRVEELNSILSDYDSDSELSRLSQTSGSGRSISVSPDLWAVLEYSQQIAVKSDGAFDVTIGPLVNLWRRTRRKQELPKASLLEEMRSRVGYKKMRLDPTEHSVELLGPDMRLDVGGIAKGYAASEAIKALAKCGITRALVAASGDIVVGDAPPGEPGWRVEIATFDLPGAPPQETLFMTHCAVSTSGDEYQFVEIDGVRYSHILNPQTGLGLTNRTLVTVVAPNGLIADGWDTTVDVLGPERGLPFIQKIPGADVRMLRQNGASVECFESPRWKDLTRATSRK